MSFINSLADRSAKLYNITTVTSASTGQPIETLNFVKVIKIHFNADNRRMVRLTDVGQVLVGRPSAVSIVKVDLNQVLEVDNTKYRVVVSNPAQFKSRIFAYILTLDRYEH